MLDETFDFREEVEEYRRRIFARDRSLCSGDAETLVVSLLEAAAEKCRQEGEAKGSHRARILFDRAETVAKRVFNVYSGHFGKDLPDRSNWRFEADVGKFVETAVDLKGFFIDQAALEKATVAYLDSGLRHPKVDRILMLAWLDVTCLSGVLSFNEADGTGGTHLQRLRDPHKSTLLSFLAARIQAAKVSFGISVVALLVLALLVRWEPARSFEAAKFLFLLVFGVDFLYAAFTTLAAFPKFLGHARQVQHGLSQIEQIHPVFRGEGPISARHFRQKMYELEATKLMNFPATLASLLDDIEYRTGSGE